MKSFKICNYPFEDFNYRLFPRAKALCTVSHLPGEFRLVLNGKIITQTGSAGYNFKWNQPLEKGAYGVEVHTTIDDKLIPCLYTNPIYFY